MQLAEKLHQLQHLRLRHSPGPAVHAEFEIDVLQVSLHGAVRDRQLRRDFPVRQTRGYQAQHLLLARADGGGRGQDQREQRHTLQTVLGQMREGRLACSSRAA